MKYLSEYTEDKTTKLLNECGAFFAFSMDQFNKAKVEGVKYVNGGMGLICPKEHIKAVREGVDKIHLEGIKQDLAENGKEGIIIRELNNYECYYTGDVEDCVDALKAYKIDQEEIEAVFNNQICGGAYNEY